MKNDINQVKALLKQFIPFNSGCEWWWDPDIFGFYEEHPDLEGAWGLLLKDMHPRGSLDWGAIGIARTTDSKWAVVTAVSYGEGTLVVCDTIKEAKHKVDLLLGLDSPDLPEEALCLIYLR